MSPFKANYGYKKTIFYELGKLEVENESGRVLAEDLSSLHKQLVEDLKFISERNTSYYNRKRS